MKPRHLLLLVLCVATASADDAREAEYQRYIADAKRHRGIDNDARARLSYLQAFRVKPDGVEALLGMAGLPGAPRTLLVREALRRHPGNADVKLAVLELRPVPKVLKFGKASRVEIFYLGRSPNDAPFRGIHSVPVGEALRRDLLIVQGLDESGNVVPVDPALSGKGGLVTDPKRPGRLLASRPSPEATLLVKDRKSGQTATQTLRLIGPVTRIRLINRDVKVGKGDILHLSAGIYDGAGNRLWLPRLAWSAKSGEKDLTKILRSGFSDVPADTPFEPHRNKIFGTNDLGFLGKLTVTVKDPKSGKSDAVDIEVVKEATNVNSRNSAKLGWVTDFAAGLKKAEASKRPILVFFEADW